MKNLILFTSLLFLFSSCSVTNKQSAVSGKPIKLSDSNFKSKIIDNENLSVVYFWASWCGPCRATGPIIDDLAKKRYGKATMAKVDVDKCPETASKYFITTLPSILIVKNGEVVGQHIGSFSSDQIKEMIKKQS